jgi:hypothetical protein
MIEPVCGLYEDFTLSGEPDGEAITPEVLKSMVVKAEIPHDNVVFIVLTVGAAKRTFVYTTVIKHGKILTITESPGFAAE